jgi:hypothetical protein
MIEELTVRVEPFLAGGTARNHNSPAALCHAWTFIDELPYGASLIPLEDNFGTA